MAVIKIWHVDNTYKPIWYVTQPKKTTTESGRQNITVLNMTIDPAQSHTGETDYRFPADEASRQMQETKKRFNADEGRQAYHAEQSFFPGEVTPEEAHRIGVEFAKKAWGDFEVVVATHVDKKHIHNHFIINSVSCIDGSKYRDDIKGEEYKRLRELNDEICLAHGLSVIEKPSQGRHKAYKTWQREQAGEEASTVREWIMEDIDRLIPTVTSLAGLYERMREIGYQVDASGKYVKVKPKGKDRFFRLHNLDKKGSYAEEKLYDRIQANLAGGSVAPETQYLYAAYRMRRVRTFVYLSRRKRSHLYGGCLYGTYLAYRHLAKLQRQGRGYTPYPTMRMRETARDLRRFSDRTVLLCDNHIHTRSELSEYQLRLKKTKEELTSQRQILRAQLRRTEEGEEITPVREEIERLNGEIKEASYQLRLCEEIDGEAELVERELEDLVQEAEQEQKQEMERQY